MTSVKNRERILEAIDQLRRRKARPDIQRICNYLFRRFAINSVEAKSELEWCVANNYVLKVEYKGNISYRNAAKKFAQMRQRGGENIAATTTTTTTTPKRVQKPALDNNTVVNSNNNNKQAVKKQFSELLLNAFGELIVEEPDYLEIGIPSAEIIEYILAKDSVRYTKKYITLLIDKEVAKGGLIKMDNGNYLMGPAKSDSDVPDRKEQRHVWRKISTETPIVVGYDGGVGASTNRNETSSSTSSYFDDVKIKIEKKSPNDGGVLEAAARKVQMANNNNNINNKQRSESFEQHIDSSTNSADERKNDGNVLRIGGRRKRAKKVFDPSDTHVPKKRGRPLGSLNKSTIEKQLAKYGDESRPDSRISNGSSSRDPGGVCSVCHLQNKRGPGERMVSCRECSNKAHFSCLNADDNMMLKMYPDNTWQCPHCKTCVVCYETSNSGSLIVCSICADAYHAGCHQPKLTEKIRSGQKWVCTNCQMPDEMRIHDIHSNIGKSFGQKPLTMSEMTMLYSGTSSTSNSSPPSPTPPQLSPQMGDSRCGNDSPEHSDSNDKDSDFDDNIDPSIPDATHWSVEEVYQYFLQYFPEEAKIFKENEIDGRSLLLLKRMDVLTNLNLKLGPALKIYKHVVKLQVRRDDPKLYWL